MNIVKANGYRAPVFVLHGNEGRGKTTLASKFKKPLFFDLEHGIPRGITVDSVEDTSSFATIMATLREIYADPHGFQCIVVDALDTLEALILKDVCTKNHWTSVETPPFGKGWVAADIEWQRFLAAVSAIRTKHGVTIVLVGHSAIERVEDPRAPSYTSYTLRLHRRARALVMDAADVVGFLAEDIKTITEDTGFNRERTRADAGPARYLFVEGRPAFAAKNRFDMGSKISIPRDFDIGNLTKFFATPTPPTSKEISP
jgi:hypothetical protein